MSYLRKILIIISSIIFLFVFAHLVGTPLPENDPVKKEEQSNTSSSIEKAFIAGKEINLILADTPQKRIRGLSGAPLLQDDAGMLFIFDEPGLHGFWMKDMNFALDIIWLGEDLKVVHIQKEVLPETYPEVFSPEKESKYVLEVNAGFVENSNLKIGDEVIFLP